MATEDVVGEEKGAVGSEEREHLVEGGPWQVYVFEDGEKAVAAFEFTVPEEFDC